MLRIAPERTPVIVGATRTPIGRFRGLLAPVRPDDLAAHVIRTLIAQHPSVVDQVDDVYFGAANQAGEDNRNLARMASLLAGLPFRTPGVTVNRLCGSGLEAIIQAAKSVIVGEGDIYIAGGSESMTRAPFVMPKGAQGFPTSAEIFNTSLGWRMVNPTLNAQYPAIAMGETAENVAEQFGISRQDQDAWALTSHQRAAAAIDAGYFDKEISPIEVPQGRKKDPITVSTDECIRRDTSIEKLSKLPAVFRSGGSVTAGNASPLNDGAAATLVMSQAKADELGFEVLANIHSWGHVGVDPSIMGIGPVGASQLALKRGQLSINDLDSIELNEAFAAQTLACIRELQLDPDKVNPNGGAIALGHPLGGSGARIITTLTHHLRRTGGRYGLASMCIGVGQGIACVLKRP